MKTRKQIIEEYLEQASLSPAANSYLADDLQRRNWRALRFLAYTIRNLPHLQNLRENLDELGRIVKGSNESESSYYNHLTEFHAVWLASYVLGWNVLALERRGVPIRSPNRTGNRSCDILAKSRGADLYLEVKDLSRETLTQRKDDHDSQEVVWFEPLLPSTCRPCSCRTITQEWVNRMLGESFEKGADYLICRIPVWSSLGAPGFGVRWMHAIFGDVKKLDARGYTVRVPFNVPSFFRGVYLIHNQRYLFLNICRC